MKYFHLKKLIAVQSKTIYMVIPIWIVLNWIQVITLFGNFFINYFYIITKYNCFASRHISGKLPSRQKSMIDLREPFWEGPRHKVHPVQVGRIPGSGSATQPPRGGPPPALVRSATEHDIRLRSRRQVGPGGPGGPPFHDLPPHIRQHMVRSCF